MEAKEKVADLLRLEYVPLSQFELWEENVKLHDIGSIIDSIYLHGFKDPPKFEPKLNDGKGGIVEGNGRSIALRLAKDDGKEPPRGVVQVEEDGEWLIPMIFGVDSDSEMAANAYGIDHNGLTLSGGNLDLSDHMRLYEDGIVDMLSRISQSGQRTAAYNADMIDLLIQERNKSDKKIQDFVEFEAEIESDFCCPKCGYEWSGSAK